MRTLLITLFVSMLVLTIYISSIYFRNTAFKSSEAAIADIAETVISDSYVSPISINYLRSKYYEAAAPVIEQELSSGINYKRYLASYISDGNKIYGLLTIPTAPAPEGGYKAIVFNHGYIPPNQYITTEKYVAYVDYLARNNFVVFKIDLRGHGNSDGIPSGSYFSSGYTIDAINAVKSLQNFSDVNPQKIGMWGHSMAGNLTLRALLISSDIKAAVIWAGAVYSYEDFATYRLSDNSYVRQPSQQTSSFINDPSRENSDQVSKLRDNTASIDFNDSFWRSISLTQNINYLNVPVQLHHAVDDAVVNVGYSRDLVEVLKDAHKDYEVYEYTGGGHNIESPYFEQAMQRTVSFFDQKL